MHFHKYPHTPYNQKKKKKSLSCPQNLTFMAKPTLFNTLFLSFLFLEPQLEATRGYWNLAEAGVNKRRSRIPKP